MRRYGRLILVLGVQAALLAAVPARQIAARAWGTPVTLVTMPVDPYDLLSGYFVLLAYEVERAAAELPLARELEWGALAWLELQEADPAWTAVALHRTKPRAAAGRVAVRVRWNGGRFEIEGAARLYLPEEKSRRAERLQTGERTARALVDCRVGSDGTVALVRLRIGDETFGG